MTSGVSPIRSMIFGTLSMSSVTVIRMLAQIMVVPILARLLSPAEYGLVGMAMPFILFVMVFSDVGMASSLVREKNQKRDEIEWSSSFWLLTALGVGLASLIIITAPFMAYFLNEPRLGPVIMTLSLVIILQSIATVPGAVLIHEKRFSTIAGIEIFSMIVSLALTFYSAINGAGVWALVIQQVAHYGCKIILTFLFSRFKPRFLFKYAQVAEHFEFGKNLLGSNMVGSLIPMINNFVVGHQLGVVAVGLITMAQLFSQLPARIVSGPLQFVLYPHMAQARDQLDSIRSMFNFITRLLSILIIPLLGMLAVAHEPIFHILLSEKWYQSGIIFMILAPAAALQSVTALRYTIMMSLGRTDMMLRQSVEGSILSLTILAITVNYGLEAVVMGMCFTSFIYFPRAIGQILPLLNMKVMEYLRIMILPTIITTLAIIAYIQIEKSSADTNDWVLAGWAFALGMVALVVTTVIQLQDLKKEYLKTKVTWATTAQGNPESPN